MLEQWLISPPGPSVPMYFADIKPRQFFCSYSFAALHNPQLLHPQRNHPNTAGPTNLLQSLRPNPQPPRHLRSIQSLPQQLLPTDIEIPPGWWHIDQKALIQLKISCRGPCVQLCRKQESKSTTCHTLRHSFPTPLLDSIQDIRTIQKPLGHKVVRTTMIVTHVLNRRPHGVGSPTGVL